MTTITCIAHGTDVSGGRCDQCYEANVRAVEKAFPNGGVTLSIPAVQQEVLVNGVVAPWYHETDWLEVALPPALYERFSKEIDVALAKFKKTCPCAQCVQQRESDGEDESD